MALDKTKILKRWDTPCSDLLRLFFVRLVDEGEQLIFSTRDEAFSYEFIFERFGPYQVADEAFLEAYQMDPTEYNSVHTSEVFPGRTCLVTDSSWAKSFNQGLLLDIYFTEGLQHYSITTSDTSLDILAAAEPRMLVTQLAEKN